MRITSSERSLRLCAFFGIESQYLPRDFPISHDEGSVDFAPRRRMAARRWRPFGVPKASFGCQNGNDGIKKTSGLVDHICQSFVMGVGEIVLKRSWIHAVDRQYRMPGKRFLIRPDDAATGFGDSLAHFCSESGWLF